ncbi:MAG: Fe2+-dependent dioxygenase [Hyphomonadaceae bacterium]|nr:Fe2+-dependent dioxygenase [Hyphomonadaceae bacterium]
MFIDIKGLLTPEEVERLRHIAGELKFVDGRLSNPGNTTKQNQQAEEAGPLYAESAKLVADAFNRSREFKDFAMPQRLAPPLLARYEAGMKYGVHADAAHLPLKEGPLRSDLSSTVFLSDPSSYEGGELVIHIGRAIPFKLKPGDAVVYPSTTLHEVRPVTKGVRLVSLTFIQSLVREEHHRDVLFELGEISALEGDKMDWLSRTRLEVVRQNLLRMWSGA